MQDRDHLRDFTGRRGKHHRLRQPPIGAEGIRLVDQQPVGIRDHMLPADDSSEPSQNLGGERLGHGPQLVAPMVRRNEGPPRIRRGDIGRQPDEPQPAPAPLTYSTSADTLLAAAP
jgi:hypothetical protein